MLKMKHSILSRRPELFRCSNLLGLTFDFNDTFAIIIENGNMYVQRFILCL